MSDDFPEKLDNLINKLSGKIQVYVKDFRENKVIYEKDSDLVIDCSNFLALPVLYGILGGIVDKKVKLKDSFDFNPKNARNLSYIVELGKTTYTIEELLEAMCITNDKNAQDLLLENVGEGVINKFLDGFGMAEIGSKYDENIQNLCKLFEYAYKRRMLTPRLCDMGIKYMERNVDRSAITRQIIDNIVVSHIDGCNRKSAGSIGIFKLDSVEYLVAINVSNVDDTITARRIIGAISRYIYEDFKSDEMV
ncbi:MAG: serine hydrolase [Lachnospirales bacterium]